MPMTSRAIGLVFALFVMGFFQLAPSRAAVPPDAVNYQGVLRDAQGEPVDGDFDMVFRFWSAESGGDELLVDRHLAADERAIRVAEGLFSVALGTGQVLDGSGPGNYARLSDVFQDFGDVWLEVQIGAETLSPRSRVQAAAYAQNAALAQDAVSLGGRAAAGFLNTSADLQAKSGRLVVGSETSTGNAWGIEAYGPFGGGYFDDSNGSALAEIASNNIGVRGFGSTMGGYFEDSTNSGYLEAGSGNVGLRAFGNEAGGYFEDRNQSGYAWLGTGEYGIRAYGNFGGGYFRDRNSESDAYAGYGVYGVQGRGTTTGGYFLNRDGSGYAFVGRADSGIRAFGDFAGGEFEETDTGAFARLGHSDYGVLASGGVAGGRFTSRLFDRQVDLAGEDYSLLVQGGGLTAAAKLDFFTTVSTEVSANLFGFPYKVVGDGTVSFVKNHADDPSKMIVHFAPEASEAGVYTRGSGRLVDGHALIQLDETFALVANPDIGLTANVTPRGSLDVLSVESVSTSELLVRGPQGSDAAFDYMVWGLRIGFEKIPPIQPKRREALLPAKNAGEELYEAEPALRRHSALERFKVMEADVRGLDVASIDLSRAEALAARIGHQEPIDRDRILSEKERAERAIDSASGEIDAAEGLPKSPRAQANAASTPREAFSATALSARHDGRVLAARGQRRTDENSEAQPLSEAHWLPVAGEVEAGDVLAFSLEHEGALVRAASLADPRIVGVALDRPQRAEGGLPEAPIAVTRIVEVKADAGFGAIRPGDLLTSAPTPGHAALAIDARPGTILGKAVEALEVGTGTIRVLLTLR